MDFKDGQRSFTMLLCSGAGSESGTASECGRHTRLTSENGYAVSAVFESSYANHSGQDQP